MKTLLAFFALSSAVSAADLVIADFEGPTYAPWTVEGAAFGTAPAPGTLPKQMRVEGYRGKGLANSFVGGDRATGKLTSPEFTISRKFIAFLIGGGGWPGQTCMNLLVDGKVVRTATGPNTRPGGSEALELSAWDVSDLTGKAARIEIVDNASGGWGHINVDHIVQTDTPTPKLLSDASRPLTIDAPLLNLPVRTGAPKRLVKVLVDGETVREMPVELADEQPDYWVFTDLTDWLGKKATITVDKLPENSAGLQLIRALSTIDGGADLYDEPLRPQFHFSSKRGWLNDPNGLAFFNGEYHMFYQHSPTTWGGSAKHWGHAVSTDLVQWRELPDALYPDQQGEMYSGSGVVDWKNSSGFGAAGKPPLVLIYTATRAPWGQCLAYSIDGRKVTKFADNPVLPQITPGNRDPKVSWHEPTQRWVMAVYVGHEIAGQIGPDGKPARRDTIQFHTSVDLKHWTFASEIEGYYECPDFFELPLDGDPKQRKWILTAANTDYQVGSFDGETFTPDGPKLRGQCGNGIYAPQTFSDEPKGRRVQIGWGTSKSPGMPFNQMMTFPCELTLRSTDEGPRLCWLPVRELEQIRGDTLREVQSRPLNAGQSALEDVEGDLLEIQAELSPGSAEQIIFTVRGTEVVYDAKAATLSCAGRSTPMSARDGHVRLQLLLDRTSLEIFGNDGLVYMPMAILPNAEDKKLALAVKGGNAEIESLKVRAIRSIWSEARSAKVAPVVLHSVERKRAAPNPKSGASREKIDAAEDRGSRLARAPISFGSFENAKLDGWTATGEAFRWMKAGERETARGVEGAGFVSSQRSGPNTRGTLASPAITVERRYINFQIAGTRGSPLVLGAQLLQGEKLLNAAGGTDEKDPSQRLAWRTWDVGALAGKQVTIHLQDDSDLGALAFDSFEQSDTARAIPTAAGTGLQRETFRPQFHFTPLAGWMNDVNGLFYYAGQWHACHQYRVPGQAQVSWGHAVSDDLLHWRHLPVVIPADGDNSAFSGSAAIDWYNTSGLQTTEHPPILLCYTLHPPGNSGRKADQRLAFSRDGGQTFAPYAGNPIIQTPDFNDRDPRLFFHAPTRSWQMVLSLTRNNTQRDLATYGIFRSWDLNAWELIQRVGPGPWYWECPDMFEIAIAGDPEHKTKWLLGKGSGDYIVGEFDGQKFTPETEPIRTQFGGSFYGAQTFSDAPEGRRVQIGWMNSGPKETTPFAYPAMPFNQQMSFPRELTLRRTPDGLRLYRGPVREIAQLYTRTVQLAPRTLTERGDDPLAPVARLPLLDLDLTIALESARRIWLTLGGETIMFDSATSRLTAFDRTIPWPIADGRLRLRALLDRTSLELFGNNGELTHSGIFFPDPATAENHLRIEGPPANLERLVVHELKSIWD